MERLLGYFFGRNMPRPSTTTPYPVNDHIYELYKPPEDKEPSMDILFFHGLQFGQSTDAYRSTWTCGSRDASEQIWPSTWLVEEFPNAHIFSMSYDSCIMQTNEHGRFDLHIVTENMVQAIVWAGIGQGLHRPVVLVGHCFGGLVMKALCVQAHNIHSLGLAREREWTHKIERFLHNVGGVFFYGTPHRGSPAFDKASFLLNSGLLLKYVKVLSKESARLQEDFTKVIEIYDIQYIASVGESLPTSWKDLFCEVVVPEASARYGKFCTVAADHIKICKPTSKTSNSFQHLITFLQDVQPKVASRFENRQLTPNALVGLDRAMKEFEGLLRLNQRVGIVGMGGIGKTTLAKAVFNKLSPAFDYSGYIHMVKKIEGSVENMEKEIWNCLHLRSKKAYWEGCWSMFKTPNRLLLVLDDMSSDRDLEVLSKIVDAIGAGESRFIVTSRDGVLLNNMDDNYRIPVLDDINAKQLFMSYAFPKEAVPPSDLESSVKNIVKKCDGLPLTLELMGKYLRNKKNVKVWEETLHDLDKANVFSQADEKLWAQLRSCYNGLGEKEQQVFLDATTFFIDTTWTLHEAITVWRSIYGSAHKLWQTLLDMSFVYDVKEGECIRVHEQLQSLGKKIASESTKCRIWEYTEALKLLQSTDESDGQQIHSLRVELDESRRLQMDRLVDRVELNADECRRWCRMERFIPPTSRSRDISQLVQREGLAIRLERDRLVDLKVDVSSSGFQRLHMVRYLDLKVNVGSRRGWMFRYIDLKVPISIQYDGPEEKPAFPTDQLVLLRCSYEQLDGLPFSPTLFTRLVVLELSCSTTVTQHLPRFIGQLLALKILKLSSKSLESLPDEIGGLSNLEYLTLECRFLDKLPTSFGDLSKLKCLEFHSCKWLGTMPDSFGQLKELKRLVFESVREESRNLCLPESFGNLPALEHLEFQSITLGSLPESFGHLPALKHLVLQSCEKLQRIPESFWRLSTLEYLRIHSCKFLSSLPIYFGHLPALKYLQFSYLYLVRLPESFGLLSTLEHLEFDGCFTLASLPESFGHLAALKHLTFMYCKTLDSLPESFGRLSSLQHLEFIRCPHLASLPKSFGQLAKLQNLVISDCPSMDRLPNSLATLKDLRRLVIEYTSLTSVPDSIKALPSLQTLELCVPCVEEFPPWLGKITPVSDVRTSIERIFHVRDGRFALAEEKTVTLDRQNFKCENWLKRMATTHVQGQRLKKTTNKSKSSRSHQTMESIKSLIGE